MRGQYPESFFPLEFYPSFFCLFDYFREIMGRVDHFDQKFENFMRLDDAPGNDCLDSHFLINPAIAKIPLFCENYVEDILALQDQLDFCLRLACQMISRFPIRKRKNDP
ncbi:hypothetical protein TNCV_4863341 [Trichonephila clavipes]|nr:hypothetical protein TNCV_4863341 [Trichonephila clavipes]